MKINKFKKLKNNIYEVTLSNGESVLLYDDIIIKYNLLNKRELDEALLTRLQTENRKYIVYYDSLKFVEKKLRTETEIRKKYKVYEPEIINYVVDRLVKESYLNDAIYLKSYINDAINLKRRGPNNISNSLQKLGFEKEQINEYLNYIEDKVWTDNIYKYINKNDLANHSCGNNLLKQKIIKSLIIMGYKKEQINEVLNDYQFKDVEDIYIKESNKALKKYSSKYSGENLEKQVKNYLYRKGF